MDIKKFYRVCNTETQQGLWYDFEGCFTGLIHREFNFCKNYNLKMPFDPEIVGYLSATETLESLFHWISSSEIEMLQQFGWCIHVYETDDYKFYDPFKHPIISQKNSKLIKKIIL